MTGETITAPTVDAKTGPRPRKIALVPRGGKRQGYTEDDLARRRLWVEEATGARLDHVGRSSLPAEEFRGNVENPIGSVQMPLGVAGPLLVRGEHADGTFYVPLATTEGAVVRSYERGMVALTRSGGATVRVWRDENRISPMFTFADVAAARELGRRLPDLFPRAKALAEATTSHGKLLAMEAHPLGRRVTVDLSFSTGDAHGMNMISRAAGVVCELLERESGALGYHLYSGREAEKHPAAGHLAGGKGKTVVAGARLSRRVVETVLGTTPEALGKLFEDTILGHVQAGAVGHNAHVANGLTALFVATGQDVANVANSAHAITEMGPTAPGPPEEGGVVDLQATVTLPSLVVATVGGGTGLPTSRECLSMLDCEGAGKAARLAEIAAATVLAGELSFSASLTAGGGFVEAHETFGRNRPTGPDQGPGRSQDDE